jgi:ribosomal RNA-processing protein 36
MYATLPFVIQLLFFIMCINVFQTATVNQLAQVDEFEQLKKKGKLESYMAKRRQKNMAKDHRYLPYARRED